MLDVLEYNVILVAWVTAMLLGLLLLFKKTTPGPSSLYYKLGKNTCAMVMLLFGSEIFFQWMLRNFEMANPFLSVSVYLFTYCAASLLVSLGCCLMLKPKLMDARQRGYAIVVLAVFTVALIVSCSLPSRVLKVRGLLVCCVLLLLITCVGLYYCVKVYKTTIGSLRRYYSDVVDNMIRWMPGVGVGMLAFLISAPFVCWLPRWVGLYQISLGIILFVYTFICVVNFDANYPSVSAAFQDDDAPVDESEALADATETASHEPSTGDDEWLASTSLSESLQEVMMEKEQRWRDNGGYRTPGMTIDRVARELGTNRSYLSRYLNEVRHVTFYEWVAQMRVTEAQSLLVTHRDLLIEKVALAVGFSSPSAFSSTFKKMVGVSPKQWRILH